MAILVLVITLCLISVEIVEAMDMMETGLCSDTGSCMVGGCKYTSECCAFCRNM